MTGTLRLDVHSVEELQSLAERLGRVAEPGDALALVGPLGSGKTTFTQGFARGLDLPAERHVSSPTFALVNEHDGRHTLVHADLYRIKTEAELAELGLEESFDRAVVVIEWADRFPACLPKDHLRVTLEPTAESSRIVRLNHVGPRGARLAQCLAK
jgi:tRNA threonylcarbamoyladenosine biosynthesis protein TsaE